MEIIGLDEVESTNTYAKNHIENFADSTVIIAKRQTSGRGRLNRSWIDLGEGNLFMSIILKPSDTFNEIYPNITQYLSVSLCKVLESYGLKPQIKWPNDVLINGEKIEGILYETSMKGQKFQGLILVIGVNLNAKPEDLTQIKDKVATSLNIEIEKPIDIQDFTDKLLKEFFDNYNEFLKHGFEYIKEDYVNRNCFLNKEISVQVFDNVKTGFAKSITDKGELVIQTKENKEIVLTIGDIL